MFHNKKKGFTIVELVIVIAVIAVLAAVLIPTFAGLIEKANVSNDTVLVKNLNTALQTQSTLDGQPQSIDDVLKYIGENGYNVDKLTPTSANNHIVYDAENNRFALVEKETLTPVYAENDKITTKPINTWFFTDTYGEHGKEYSYYLTNDCTLPVESMTVTTDTGDITAEFVKVNAGISLSKLTTKYNVYFETSEEVTASFVMNGGMFVVKAANGTIHSYGEKSGVVVLAVANNSYHEYGKVIGNIIAQAGRVVIEPKASAPTVLVTTNSVKIDNRSEEPTTIAPTTEEAKAAIDTIVTNKGNATVQETVVDAATANYFAGGLGTKESPYLIATAEQFGNINTVFTDSSEKYYFKQIDNIVATTPINNFAGSYDGNGYSWTATYYYKTSNYSFMIQQAIGHVEVKNLKVEMKNFPICVIIYTDWGTAYGADFENIEFNSDNLLECNVNNFGLVAAGAIYPVGSEPVTYNFKNIVNNADFQNNGTCTGFIVGSGPCANDPECAPVVLNYENCVNNGTITGTSQVGFFYGNGSYIASSVKNSKMDENSITMKNCKNNGSFLSVNDSGAVVTAAPYFESANTEFNKTATSNLGGTFLASNFFNDDAIGYLGINQSGSNLSINIAENNQVSYKIAFVVGSIYMTEDRSAWDEKYENDLKGYTLSGKIGAANSHRYYIDLPVDTTATNTVNAFHAYDYRTAVRKGIVESGTELEYKDGFCLIIKDGVNYLIIETADYVYINSTGSMMVYAYDNSGNLIGIKTIK